MDKSVLVALIAAAATVSAALIAALLGKRKSTNQNDEPPSNEFSDPNASIRKTEIETVRIVIKILASGEKHEVEVPLDIQVSVLIELLTKRLELPAITYSGIARRWHMRSVTRGLVLVDHLSMRDNGVRELETFVFYEEMVAG